MIENIGTTENQTEVKNHLFEIDLVAMKAEFKLSLNAYLSDLLYSPVRSLAGKCHSIQQCTSCGGKCKICFE